MHSTNAISSFALSSNRLEKVLSTNYPIAVPPGFRPDRSQALLVGSDLHLSLAGFRPDPSNPSQVIPDQQTVAINLGVSAGPSTAADHASVTSGNMVQRGKYVLKHVITGRDEFAINVRPAGDGDVSLATYSYKADARVLSRLAIGSMHSSSKSTLLAFGVSLQPPTNSIPGTYGFIHFVVRELANVLDAQDIFSGPVQIPGRRGEFQDGYTLEFCDADYDNGMILVGYPRNPNYPIGSLHRVTSANTAGTSLLSVPTGINVQYSSSSEVFLVGQHAILVGDSETLIFRVNDDGSSKYLASVPRRFPLSARADNSRVSRDNPIVGYWNVQGPGSPSVTAAMRDGLMYLVGDGGIEVVDLRSILRAEPYVSPYVSIKSAVEISWESSLGSRYSLESADSILGPWSKVGEPVVGTGSVMSLFQGASQGARFYRIVLVP